MLNLLRYSSSPVNGMQEVFAVDLLGELLAGNQELKTELQNLKKQINPLARAAMHRAEFKKFNDDMALKQKEMEKLMGEIKHLKDLLEQRRGRISTPPPPAPTSPPADANGYQQETQLFEEEATQADQAYQQYSSLVSEK